ncbi:hypothetical protein HYDPIDRAFT_83317 [Hydnomerulius pinastri MD-312]|nr:hypothetical protein HYDPIDRAFT_83317 [Hydnomerulius pinastri MD-312]
MTSGPPPSQAGPSSQAPAAIPSTSEAAPQQQQYYASIQQNAQTTPSQQQPIQYAHAQPLTQPQSQLQGQQQQNPAQAYYTMSYPPGAWQNAWQLSGYPYATSGSAPYQQTHYTQIPYAQYQSYQPQPQPTARHRAKPQPKPRTPTPEPLYRHWDEVIRAFLKKVGLSQALRGFEDDMVVLNADWERKSVPGAIGDLVRDLMTLGKFKEGEEPKERPLDERKLDYVHLNNGAEPQSQSTTIKSISQFLAQNRAKNDASNRAEFLQSLAQKRRRLNIEPESTEPIPSCARTDAKHLDRDSQMKYDIAKNEDGPLRRTMKVADGTQAKKETLVALTDDTQSEHQPALDERLKNIESHLAVRYGRSPRFLIYPLRNAVPARPRTLLARLNFLEEHIIQLEKEYPPWAALHFNQPNRGWPPPPRQTPIIVPSHITAKNAPAESTNAHAAASTSVGTPDELAVAPAKGKNKNKSSLHRAVMEKLEVQKAMSDLAGAKRGS